MQLRDDRGSSPMAAPTRFTEPQRTSPTAKIPRPRSPAAAALARSRRTSAPVRMKPFSSRGMPQPVSQLAAGSAPVKRNRWAMACCSSAPVRRLRHRTPCRPWSGAPRSSTTSVSQSTAMFGAAAIRSMR